MYDAVDTDEDGSLSPVRALIFTFARLDPHVASLFGRLSVRLFGCLQEELRDAIVRLTGSTIGSATLDRLVQFLDKDRNGSIDRSEFREGISFFARATKAGVFEEEDSDSDLDELEASPEELKKALLRPVNE
eukprot:COSAG02_NODE_1497_length_12282_cov_757.962571_4_plen_132_part_00